MINIRISTVDDHIFRALELFLCLAKHMEIAVEWKNVNDVTVRKKRD